MLKIYRQDWIANRYIQKAAHSWQNKGMISQEQRLKVQEQFPDLFYNPSLGGKIGLFIFTTVAAVSALGLVNLMVGFDSTFILIVSSVLVIGCLEITIKRNHLYHSGIDTALLFCSVGLTFLAFITLFPVVTNGFMALFLFLICLLATLRYADTTIALIGLTSLTFFVMHFGMAHLHLGMRIIAFLGMCLAAGIYYKMITMKYEIYYEHCKQGILVFCYLLFYYSTHYILSEQVDYLQVHREPIVEKTVLSNLFYSIFILLVPFGYICFSLYYKNRALLTVGLLTLAISVYILFIKFQFISLELMLIVSGISLICTSIILIRFLKNPKYGFSDHEVPNTLLPIEYIIIAQQAKFPSSQSSGLSFGEGDFGGGGSGDQY
jgi:hypothetical protein